MTKSPVVKGPLHKVLRALSQRIDFTAGKFLLQSHGLPISIGWDSSINSAVAAASGRTDLAKILVSLNDSFRQHALVGEKAVVYYGFGGLPKSSKIEHGKQVRNVLTAVKIPNSKYRQAFPLAIFEEDELRDVEHLRCILTEIIVEPTRVCFIFSSIRSFNERVDIDTAKFSPADKAFLSDYSELIGVRAIRRQCFDCVVFDLNRELIELRIDSPEGTPAQQKQDALQDLKSAFNALQIFTDGWNPFGGTPTNFHDLMNRLYANGREGSVFQLGFTASSATTSSNNGAKLLRKRNFDLRKDVFHVGGAKAVKDISPYTIGVEWISDNKISQPKLIVPGSVRALYKPPIIFPELFIRSCFTEEQYELIMRKVDKYK